MRKENNLIEGIYNYCDRWCERCAFNKRCYVGLEEAELKDGDGEIDNEVFWQKLSESFAKTMTIIRKEADKRGISLEMSDEERAEFDQNQKKVRAALKEIDLMKISESYGRSVQKWQETMRPILEEKRDELIEHIELGLSDEDETIEKMSRIKQSLDVIFWYSWFISAKFNRALRGKIEDTGWERLKGFQRDFDGSAKIALIAAERSLSAWAQLADALPYMMDDMLPMMANLQKIIRLGDVEFKNARKFKRPGFDE